MEISEFDDIRPYNQSEFLAAMCRIADSNCFSLLSSYVYPDESLDAVRQRLRSFKDVRAFQSETMSKAIGQIVKRSISHLEIVGLDNLSPNGSYLYVSNHRDIMLDSALLQYLLLKHGFDTTEITFGENLMANPLVVDIGKSNKMFKVARPSKNIKDFYLSSRHLSNYLHYVIAEKHQSAWIAQRNGRTKNGIDATDQGIIKMFGLCNPSNKIDAIADLNIVPMSISYEWESCDILKTLELYESQFSKYTKKPGEDLNSIITGIMQHKGQVHIELCEPISKDELMPYEQITNNEYHKAVAKLIDSRINLAYRLFPNNYIAYDIRYGTNKFRDMYTTEQKNAFVERMNKLDDYDTCDICLLKDLFMSIYSNPVINRH